MPSVTIPTVIAGVGAAGQLASGIMGSNATSDAANQQAQIANQASAQEIAAGQQGSQILANYGDTAAGLYGGPGGAIQQAMNIYGGTAAQTRNDQLGLYGNTSSAIAPYMSAGTSALSQLSSLLGIGGNALDPQDTAVRFANTPGYQFAMNQGLTAINNSGAAKGLLNSGSTGKALTEFGQGLAGTTFNNYLSQLAGVAGYGQNAGNTLAQTGVATGSQLGASALGNANGQSNALLSGTSGLVNALGNSASGQANSLLAGAGGSINPTLQAANATGAGIVGANSQLTSGINGALNNSLLAYQLAQQGGGWGSSNTWTPSSSIANFE